MVWPRRSRVVVAVAVADCVCRMFWGKSNHHFLDSVWGVPLPFVCDRESAGFRGGKCCPFRSHAFLVVISDVYRVTAVIVTKAADIRRFSQTCFT